MEFFWVRISERLSPSLLFSFARLINSFRWLWNPNFCEYSLVGHLTDSHAFELLESMCTRGDKIALSDFVVVTNKIPYWTDHTYTHSERGPATSLFQSVLHCNPALTKLKFHLSGPPKADTKETFSKMHFLPLVNTSLLLIKQTSST